MGCNCILLIIETMRAVTELIEEFEDQVALERGLLEIMTFIWLAHRPELQHRVGVEAERKVSAITRTLFFEEFSRIQSDRPIVDIELAQTIHDRFFKCFGEASLLFQVIQGDPIGVEGPEDEANGK